jgi:hypothetical protein
LPAISIDRTMAASLTLPADAPAADGLWFGKDLSTPEAVPEVAIARAVALMRSGRLHHHSDEGCGHPEPSLLEQEYPA